MEWLQTSCDGTLRLALGSPAPKLICALRRNGALG
jgi:hypothetical protein